MPEIILKTENLTWKPKLRQKKKTVVHDGNAEEDRKEKCAVNHVSLTLNHGDVYGLVGADGPRTMFLRLVCGLTKPAEGSVSLFGVSGESRLRRDSGMVTRLH